MARILHTYPLLTIWRIVLLYIVLALCRICFVCFNSEIFGSIEWNEVPSLIEGALRFDTVSILYVNAVWVIFSLLPLRLRERRWYSEILYWYYVVVNSLTIVAVNMSDIVYFRYTQKRFTAEEILFADNSNSALLVVKFMAENWHLVLLGLLFIAILAKGYGRRWKPTSLLRGVAYYGVSTLIFLSAIALSIGGIRGGFSRMVRPIAVPVAMQYANNSQKANIVLSNPFCILRNISGESVSVPHYFDDTTLMRSIYTTTHTTPTTPAVSLEGRNVVWFVLESFSAEHSAHLCPDLYNGGKERGYTPFLDSLMREGYTFHRMYANGKRSIQALPSIWSSIPSFREPFMLMPASLGESRPAPRILSDMGYTTAFFCGSERGSMGFGAYANGAGFAHNYSMNDYEERHGKGDFDNYWGIWDDCFISYMGEEIDTMQQPFLASIFTISSHHPFVVPTAREGNLPKGETKVHRCIAYTDDAVRRFFEKNGDKEWFKNTIFIFVADHVSSERFGERTHISPYDLHIVGFIYTPDGALKGEYHSATSQIDLMPTLLGMLGCKEEYFAYGRDIFNEPQEPRVLVYDNGYKVITDHHLFIFDEERVTAVYALDDLTRSCNLVGTLDILPLENYIKSFIQQYYENAKQKCYCAPEPTSGNAR